MILTYSCIGFEHIKFFSFSFFFLSFTRFFSSPLSLYYQTSFFFFLTVEIHLFYLFSGLEVSESVFAPSASSSLLDKAVNPSVSFSTGGLEAFQGCFGECQKALWVSLKVVQEKGILTFWCCQPTSHSQVILPVNERILDTTSDVWTRSDSCFISFKCVDF